MPVQPCRRSSFHLNRIDSLLDGGIQMGDVIELSGAASQGKTQLSLFCSLCAILLRLEGHSLPPVVRPRDSLGTVLYLDTANAFSPTRILELFNGSDRFQSARESGIVGLPPETGRTGIEPQSCRRTRIFSPRFEFPTASTSTLSSKSWVRWITPSPNKQYPFSPDSSSSLSIRSPRSYRRS